MANIRKKNNTVGNESLRDIASKIPPLTKKDLTNIVIAMTKDFPKLVSKMQANEAWKKVYDSRGFIEYTVEYFFSEYSSSNMEKKKTETLFLLLEASKLQIDSIQVVLQLSLLIGRMEYELAQQQQKICKQQEHIKKQQTELKTQNEELKNQQNQLKKQNDEIKQAQQRLKDDNDKLLESAKILEELRQVGNEHDVDIDEIKRSSNKTMSGLEKALVQVMLLSRDLKEIESKICHKVENKYKQILCNACRASQNVTWK